MHDLYADKDADVLYDSIMDVYVVNNICLYVDKRLVIPTDLNISVSVTSTDVIHSWSVPQLGIKIDAVPGRISNVVICALLEGVFFGQCSELCGVLHGFMPITVESVPLRSYIINFVTGSYENDVDVYVDLGLDSKSPSWKDELLKYSLKKKPKLKYAESSNEDDFNPEICSIKREDYSSYHGGHTSTSTNMHDKQIEILLEKEYLNN